jgi:hypothetical protein
MSNEHLTPPLLPAAAPDGLISSTALDNDLVVLIEVPDGVRDGDSYQLLLNNQLVGARQVFPCPAPPSGFKLRTHISNVGFESDGMYEISYRYITYPGGNIADSAPTRVWIDRTPPGAPLLAPVIFPTATFGNQLSGLIPGYVGMAQGDVIQTLLNGIPGPAHNVQPAEITIQPINIAFSREHLQGLGAGIVSIEYFVTDRAGNASITSLPSLVSLQL